eukprot:4726038-Alexandrium_andersonii.AAC.1
MQGNSATPPRLEESTEANILNTCFVTGSPTSGFGATPFASGCTRSCWVLAGIFQWQGAQSAI